MDNRSWESAAAASAPSAPASPSAGYPTDGNPSLAVPATIPGAYWFHQLGEELRAILSAASITPDKAVLTQFLTALRSAGVFTTPALGDRTTKAATMACFSQEFASSIAVNGYQKLPTGIIIQWGTANAGGSATGTVTFPIAFPTACLACLATDSTSISTNVASIATEPTASNFAFATAQGAAAFTAAGQFNWLSVGY